MKKIYEIKDEYFNKILICAKSVTEAIEIFENKKCDFFGEDYDGNIQSIEILYDKVFFK